MNLPNFSILLEMVSARTALGDGFHANREKLMLRRFCYSSDPGQDVFRNCFKRCLAPSRGRVRSECQHRICEAPG